MRPFFHIVVPFYNVEQWIVNCIRSIKAQEYKNYKVVLVNDMSTDNTVEIIDREILDNDQFTLISTGKNGGALNSAILGIEAASPAPEDVIIVLDGDDWLAKMTSLTVVANSYHKEGCLLTYGSYAEFPGGMRGKFSKKVPDEVLKGKLFRENEWMTSHLRTFKYKLWEKIKKEDVLDEDGKVFSMAGDLPVMFPMLEMAEERSHFIEELIHVYNRSNPLNEDKVNHSHQLRIEAIVRRKTKYPRLEEMD